MDALNVDLGGAKNANTQEGRWRICDIAKSADYRCDLNSGDPLPFTDCSVSNYYFSHTLEHVAPTNTLTVLREIHRTLQVGGIVRIVVPDIRRGVEFYLKNPEIFEARKKILPSFPDGYYPKTPLGYLMSWFMTPDRGDRSGHKMGFDWQTLKWVLLKAGFIDVRRMDYNVCSSVFAGKDLEKYKLSSLYVEGRKQ